MNTIIEPEVKSYPIENIAKITIGETDLSGNKIVFVHSKHNEYAIYEIDTNEINNRLKVLIDGYTDKSEKLIQDRFNKVKQDYIQAIGLLSNSPNTEMLKRRIAHTLSTCLNSSEVDGNGEFKRLIDIIKGEHQKLVINRLMYLVPVFILTSLSFAVSLIFFYIYAKNIKDISPAGYLSCLFLSVSIGASISILINTTKLNFEEYSLKKYYLILGCERVFLAIATGSAAFISIQAGLLFPEFTKDSIWGTMVALIIVGFSESLIPSFLTKIEGEKPK